MPRVVLDPERVREDFDRFRRDRVSSRRVSVVRTTPGKRPNRRGNAEKFKDFNGRL